MEVFATARECVTGPGAVSSEVELTDPGSALVAASIAGWSCLSLRKVWLRRYIVPSSSATTYALLLPGRTRCTMAGTSQRFVRWFWSRTRSPTFGSYLGTDFPTLEFLLILSSSLVTWHCLPSSSSSWPSGMLGSCGFLSSLPKYRRLGLKPLIEERLERSLALDSLTGIFCSFEMSNIRFATCTCLSAVPLEMELKADDFSTTTPRLLHYISNLPRIDPPSSVQKVAWHPSLEE